MKDMPVKFVIPAIIFAAAALVAASPQANADVVDTFVSAQMQTHQIPGLAIAVVEDGAVIKQKAYGFADVDKKVPVSNATAFEIGGLTRSLTAEAVMLLVDEGKISLDDSVTKYLTDAPAAWNAVTLRSLLTHTSGIMSYTDKNDLSTLCYKGYTADQVIGLVKSAPLNFTPGAKVGDSETDYYLLGKVIEKVTGQSYGDFLTQHVLTPLGMTSTHVAAPGADPDVATGYVVNAAGTAVKGVAYTADVGGASSSLVSTVSDLVRWNAAIDAGQLLKPASLQQVFVPFRLKSGIETRYGLGWNVKLSEGAMVAEVTGATPSQRSAMVRDVTDNVAVIVLTNANGSYDPVEIARTVLDLYVPSLIERPIPDDPRVTAFVKDVLVHIQSGANESSMFSPPLWSVIGGHDIASFAGQIKQAGPLKAVTLVDKLSDNGLPVYGYRCLFGDLAVDVRCGPSLDGKIGNFDWEID